MLVLEASQSFWLPEFPITTSTVCWHFTGETEETHEKAVSMAGLRFEIIPEVPEYEAGVRPLKCNVLSKCTRGTDRYTQPHTIMTP
jgi:hypothetical protein